MRIYILSFLFFIITAFNSECIAQHFTAEWVNHIGGPESSLATSTCTDNTGNVYISGRIAGTITFNMKEGGSKKLTSKGNSDIFLAKYDATGKYIWAISMGGDGNEFTNTVAVDNAGSVLIIGQYQGDVNFNPAGSYILSSTASENIFLAKYNSTNGQFIWAKSMGGNGTSRGHYVTTDRNNNIFITANFTADIDVDPSAAELVLPNNKGNFREFFGKYDSNGNLVWAHPLGYGEGGGTSSIPIMIDSNTDDVVISGDFASDFDFSFTAASGATINTNVKANFLAKYTNGGVYKWVKHLPCTGVAKCQALQIGQQSDIVIFGDFTNTFFTGTGSLVAKGNKDLFLSTYTSNGTLKQAQSFGGSGATIQPTYASIDPAGNVITSAAFTGTIDVDNQSAGGVISSGGLGKAIFISKYDASGKSLDYDFFGGQCSSTVGYRMAVFNENIYLAGGFCQTVDFAPSACETLNLTAISSSTDIYLGKYVLTTAPTIANTIIASGVTTFCTTGNPAVITGNIPPNTPDVTYQWQGSANGTNFANINGAKGKDFDPPSLNSTTYFRRIVTISCGQSLGNVVKIEINTSPDCNIETPSSPQLCGSPGVDGSINPTSFVNTYFPPQVNVTLSAGGKSISLGAVPPTDTYGNSFGNSPIKAGDLLLIIQMQDAEINFSNSTLYGGNQANSGPDGAGATGYTDLGNSGRYEYIIATNNVTITGGTLQFKGSGNGNGTVYSYVNADATATRGRRTFQIVRIPQYSNLKLSSNISAPPFNGRTGGIIAFNVAGGMDFNGYTIDATARGFRGGYSLVKEAVGNIKDLYVADASNPRVSGKGEGIAGTPRYMWDGYNEINNGVEGLPGGSGGRGAPANAGGGGNDTNAGGGGGGNGGAGGNGGGGYAPIGGELPSGGRPGMNMPIGVARLVMGGGGGGGHANDAVTGVKGGVGGGVVLITAGTITGTGQVLANGSDGSKGVSGPNPDGSGGGGAGGSVFINVLNNSSANLSVQAKGGKGGNTERDPGGGGVQPHGPGGGGGGGTVFYTPASGTVTANVAGGNSGLSNAGEGIPNLATNGLAGSASAVAASALPDYLTSNGTCYPELVTTMIVSEPTVAKPAGSTVTYTITTTNRAAESSAAGVRIECLFPQEITFVSAIATYTGNASGSPQITNQGTAVKPLFGDFNIPAGGVITLTIFAQTDCNASGTYNSSAQASYLDPTRTFATSTRRITAAAGAFANSNTTYETGVTGDVPGKNYNGAPGTETGEDVNVLPPPANVNTIVKTDTESAYCVSTNPAVIAGNTPVNGTISYQWQVASGGGGFVDITGAVSKDYNPPVINTSTAYRRVVTAQPCAKIVMSNEVHYNITALPPAPTVPPQTICANTAATFTVTTPQPGLTYNWYADAGRVNLLGSGTSFTTTPLVATTTFYAEAVSGTCTSVTLTNVQAIVTAPPAAPVVAGFAPVCAGTPITLNISAPQGGVLYKWYSASTGGNSIYTGTGFGLQPVATITYYAEANNGSCPSQRTPVTVTVLQAPSAPIVQGAFICPGSTATLTANAGQGVTVKWYDAVNSTAEIFTGNMFITPPLNASTTYYAETVNDNGGCTSVTRTAVNADIARRLDAPMVTVGETTIKSVTFNWTIVAGATGYEVSTDDGQTYNNIGNVRTYTISSLSANQSVTLMVRAVGTSSCETSVSGSVTGVSINPELDKIYIPNIFTPNGDGNNDVLYVRSLGIKTLVFYVYDQWGEMIFRSNNQASGWDGTYKGTVMPVGVYVYYVEAIMLDGQKQNKKGTITLLR